MALSNDMKTVSSNKAIHTSQCTDIPDVRNTLVLLFYFIKALNTLAFTYMSKSNHLYIDSDTNVETKVYMYTCTIDYAHFTKATLHQRSRNKCIFSPE